MGREVWGGEGEGGVGEEERRGREGGSGERKEGAGRLGSVGE